jgi:endoglucanase
LRHSRSNPVIWVMKTAFTFLLTILWFTTVPVSAQSSAPDAFAQNRQLGRGVNILGYDPIWRTRDQARFKAKYFRQLKEAGFNSVRINLHAFRHMDASSDWKLRESWFEVLDWALQNTQEQGLVAILDLHEYNVMGEDPIANHGKFLAFWRQISARYQNAPESVFFEVLNEPSKKLTPALWNDYLQEALTIIREKNPTRAVIVGPAFWNSINHLDELKLPGNDRHLIVTVHFYEPFAFTHQGASWTDRKDKLGFDWTGSTEQLAALDAAFDRADAWAKKNQRPIFVGEFGAYDRAPMDSRARWTSAVARATESRGWSWAYWQFDNDFILYDVKRDAWVEPILKALIPKTPSAK